MKATASGIGPVTRPGVAPGTGENRHHIGLEARHRPPRPRMRGSQSQEQ